MLQFVFLPFFIFFSNPDIENIFLGILFYSAPDNFFFNQYSTDKILSLSVMAKFRVLASVSIATSTLKRVTSTKLKFC